VNKKNKTLETPMHYLAEGSASIDIAKLLYEYGADINAKRCGEVTPLHSAASHEKEALIDYLLSVNANPNAADCEGSSPLTYAIMRKNIKIINKLIKYGSEIDEDDINTGIVYVTITLMKC